MLLIDSNTHILVISAALLLTSCGALLFIHCPAPRWCIRRGGRWLVLGKRGGVGGAGPKEQKEENLKKSI